MGVSEFGVQATSMNLNTNLGRSQQEKHKHTQVISSSSRMWKPPPQGWLKVNIDAAVFTETGSIGIGCVIRNENRSFVRVRARNQRIEVYIQPREAEVVGLKEALSWTKEI